MKTFSSALELINNTPLVELKRLKKELGLFANIYAKVESLNLTGSIKDRIVLSIVSELEKTYKIDNNFVVIEATSGNTGIALSAIAAIKQFKAIIVMPENMSKERITLIKAYGGKVILTPEEEGMEGSLKKLEELKKHTKHIKGINFINTAMTKAADTINAVKTIL